MASEVREQACPSPQAPAASAASSANGHARYEPPSEAIGRLKQLIGEFKEYLAYYLSAKTDSYKSTIRNVGIYAALGMVGLVAGAALLVTACVLLLVGIAGGLTMAMGPGLAWLADLIVGIVVLAGAGLGGWLALKLMTKSFRSSTVKKYEQRQKWQRGQFGRSVRDAAREGAGQSH